MKTKSEILVELIGSSKNWYIYKDTEYKLHKIGLEIVDNKIIIEMAGNKDELILEIRKNGLYAKKNDWIVHIIYRNGRSFKIVEYKGEQFVDEFICI